MNAPVPRHPAGRFLVHHYVELLTVFAVLFVLQTGLIPFDFFAGQVEAGRGKLFAPVTSPYTLADIFSNTFLYLPIGVFLYWSLCRRRCRGAAAAFLAVGLAAALSGAIEWLQAYSPTRVSSIIDFISNVVGAGVGVAISGMARWIVPRLIGAALHEFHHRPQAALLKAYCGMLVLAAALPFSFSLDVGLLKRSVESATWVPFGAVAEYDRAADEALAAGNYWQYSFTKWQGMKRWSRWAAEAASFALLVWLAQPFLRGHYGFSSRGAVALVCWLCGGLAIGLSLLQLGLVTRGFDVTDIVFRGVGILGGLSGRSLHDRTDDNRLIDGEDARWRRLVPIGCVATLAYIVYLGVIPLTFPSEPGGLLRASASREFWPFFGYFITRFDLMMDDVMEKFGAYALFAALLVTCWSRVRDLPMWSRVARVTIVGVALSIPLEIVQAYIPVRVTSLTDLILAGGGCIAGVLAQEHAVRFYRFAVSHELPAMDGSRPEPGVPAGFSPTDVLVGSLLDPDENAPAERPFTGKPTPRR